MANDEQVGAGVKAFVAVFLAAFTVCGLFQVEAWPFSGWALFSHLRTDEVRGWVVTGVDAGGVERPIPFSTFPPAYRGQQHVLDGFDGLSPERRLDVCRAWAAETARTDGIHVNEIRVYRLTESARHPGSGRRDLRYVCPRSSDPIQ